MIDKIQRILEAEAQAIRSIPLSASVERAVHTLATCRGKVFTTGIGKAGYVAQKAASTFSTTGTPSCFVHPADASHGDIGVVGPDDVLIAFSNSGETREVLETLAFCRKLRVSAVIGITSNKSSTLGRESDITLEIGKIAEPCPFGLTPSASTSAMIALSDALALVTMQQRGFTSEDFALRHHGGYLGKKARGN